MHLDVIGVPVPAPFVVGRERGRSFVVEDDGETRRRFVDVGRPERAGVVNGRGVHHSRIAVTEELDPAHAEDLGRAPGFSLATLGERLVGLEHAVVDLADVAARREHEHHAMALGDGAGDGAAHDDALVVGMRVERDQRAGTRVDHAQIVAHGPSSAGHVSTLARVVGTLLRCSDQTGVRRRKQAYVQRR